MSLMDLVHALEARRKGNYNDELKIVNSILEDTSRASKLGVAGLSKEIASKSGLLSKMGGIGKKAVATALIGTSLLFGGMAEAKNYVPVGKNVDVLQQHKHLKYLTDYVSGLYTQDIAKKGKARRILYRTAIHESQNLQHRRQVVKVDGKLLEAGPARSIFGVEAETAYNLVDWAESRPKAMKLLTKTSGLSARHLSNMNKDSLADLLMTNEKFAAAMARVKFLSVSGAIPEGLEAQAGYTAKKYYVGKKEGRAQLQAKYEKQFIDDNIRFQKSVAEARAAANSKAAKSVINTKPVKHAIANGAKKVAHLFRR